MASTVYATSTSFLEFVKRNIEQHVKDEVLKQVTEQYVKEFRTLIESILKSEVEKLTIESVHTMYDYFKIANELNVMVTWKRENNEQP